MAFSRGPREEFIGYIEFESHRAFLFQGHYWTGPLWLPKSQVTVTRYDDTPEVRMLASSWICGKNNVKENEHRIVTDKDMDF